MISREEWCSDRNTHDIADHVVRLKVAIHRNRSVSIYTRPCLSHTYNRVNWSLPIMPKSGSLMIPNMGTTS